MALAGDLREFSVEQVLRLLQLSHQTGTLVVRTAEGRTAIEVTTGAVTTVRGDEDPTAALGLVLDVREGTFAFKPGATGEAQIDLPLEELLPLARAQAAEAVKIRAAIPGDDARFALSERATAGTSFTVSSEELRILMAVAGGRTVREVRQQGRYGSARTRSLLYGLLQKGLVTHTKGLIDQVVETTGSPPPSARQDRPPKRRAATAAAAPAPTEVPPPPPIIEAAQPDPSASGPPVDDLLDPSELSSELDVRLAALSSMVPPSSIDAGVPAALAVTSEPPTPEGLSAPSVPEARPADLVMVTPSESLPRSGASGPSPGATVLFKLHYFPETARPELEPKSAPAPAAKHRGIFDLFRLRRPSTAEPVDEVLDIPSPAELARVANELATEYERLAEAKRELAGLKPGAFETRLSARLERIYALRPVGARIPLSGDSIDVAAMGDAALPPGLILPYLALLIRDLRTEAERVLGSDDAHGLYEMVVGRIFGRSIATPTRILTAADRPVHARLVVRSGAVTGPFELRDRAYTIGRSPACDIVIADPGVSGRHAQLVPDLQGFRIKDLGSRNGTTLDGRRLEGERALRGGEVIGVGDTLLAYERDVTAAGP